jgi:hypothetical protein
MRCDIHQVDYEVLIVNLVRKMATHELQLRESARKQPPLNAKAAANAAISFKVHTLQAMRARRCSPHRAATGTQQLFLPLL